MTRKSKLLIAASLIVAVGAFAAAGVGFAHGDRHGGKWGAYSGGHHSGGFHGGGHHGGRHHGERAHRMMERFDVDQDGKLTQAEIDQAREANLASFDGDKDGALSLQEFEGLWLDHMRERMVDRFQNLDADGDSLVTLEEFKRPFASLVQRMDRDGDGALSRADKRSRHGDRHDRGESEE